MQQTGNDVTETKLVKLWDRLAYAGFLPFIWANWLVHSLGKWYVRFRTGNWISTRNRIYYLYKSLPFTERPETGIKDGFEEMKKKNK